SVPRVCRHACRSRRRVTIQSAQSRHEVDGDSPRRLQAVQQLHGQC
ncbi:hypothetical protein BN1723_019500, partial [Verticillium longisporum]